MPESAYSTQFQTVFRAIYPLTRRKICALSAASPLTNRAYFKIAVFHLGVVCKVFQGGMQGSLHTKANAYPISEPVQALALRSPLKITPR